MVEIRERNPKLRLAINILITIAFLGSLGFFVWNIISHKLEAQRLGKEIRVLQEDYELKHREYVIQEDNFKRRRAQMSSREMVETSLNLQQLDQSLKVLSQNLTNRMNALEEEQDQMRRSIYAVIFCVVGYVVVMWINYILNY